MSSTSPRSLTEAFTYSVILEALMTCAVNPINSAKAKDIWGWNFLPTSKFLFHIDDWLLIFHNS